MSTLQTQRNWELEFIKTGDINCVPEEDRERVLRELQELCELSKHLLEHGEV